MNKEVLEEFEKTCEFYKKEYKQNPFGSTAIFKPYSSFENLEELNSVLENCKRFLKEFDSNSSVDYFLTLRGSVQFEWELELDNNIVEYIEVEIFKDKIIANFSFWDDTLNGNEKIYETQKNWERIEKEIDGLEENNGFEENKGFEDICRWIENKLSEYKNRN